MALSALKYEGANPFDETRGGVYIFDGTPSKFFEWEFRTQIRSAGAKPDDKLKTLSMIVEGLRGEASQVAMDLGTAALMDPAADGAGILVTAMTARIFPQARAEAKELYRVGHKTRGILSRQTGEPMVFYLTLNRSLEFL